MNTLSLAQAMEKLPLVAILRGVTPSEVVAVAKVIKEAGFGVIEVPLNSPQPYESIKLLCAEFGEELVIGAGTVLSCEQVDKVKDAGGRIIISPNSNIQVIGYAKKLGLYSVPGFYTPTEAFAALDAGADAIKLFPADTLGPQGLKAMMAVLPKGCSVLPVGGVSHSTMAAFLQAGAKGFGLGSGLFTAGMTLNEVKANAQTYAASYKTAVETN